jgi:uncharacterized DUF497 family protein
MLFEWDESKNNACFEKRGFDFEFAAQVLFDPNRLVAHDNRRSYGEDRYQVTGIIDGRLYVVVFTPRRASQRIITARKANQREIKRYENSKN